MALEEILAQSWHWSDWKEFFGSLGYAQKNYPFALRAHPRPRNREIFYTSTRRYNKK